MIKFKQGCLYTTSGEAKDIIVKAATPNTIKDMLIGGGLVLVGITYLTVTAFRNGSRKFEEAEFNAMSELGLIADKVKETIDVK